MSTKTMREQMSDDGKLGKIIYTEPVSRGKMQVISNEELCADADAVLAEHFDDYAKMAN